MVQGQSNSKMMVLAVLVVGGGAIGIAALSWSRSEPEPKPVPKTVEAPVVQREAPKTVEPVKEEAPKELSEAEKALMLGLNKQEPKENIVQEPKRPAPRRIKKRTDDPKDNPPDDQDDGTDAFSRPQIGLSDADFHKTIERWRGMKSCLHTHKGRKEDQRGALRISMKITGAGEVAECKVFDETNEVARLIAPCVEKQARQLRFPAFEGEPFALKEAKFVF